MEQRIPADPADPESREAVLAQAGQVWFPDSAHKTAQALRDFDREGIPAIIFANWRGFSGGTRDMHGEILKFGAMIVDALREYNQPVFIYIPKKGELRGGAWVVVDPTINQDQMEMYADTEARGGILEPPGICEVKYRAADQNITMHRLDPVLQELDGDKTGNAAAIAKREESLAPLYVQIAHEFADLHDRSGRMAAKGVVRKALEWQNSREFFFHRLVRRLAEDGVVKEFKSACPDMTSEEIKDHCERLLHNKIGSNVDWDDDVAIASWIKSDRANILKKVGQLKRETQIAEAASMIADLDPAARREILESMASNVA